jgi:hypothetical protein
LFLVDVRRRGAVSTKQSRGFPQLSTAFFRLPPLPLCLIDPLISQLWPRSSLAHQSPIFCRERSLSRSNSENPTLLPFSLFQDQIISDYTRSLPPSFHPFTPCLTITNSSTAFEKTIIKISMNLNWRGSLGMYYPSLSFFIWPSTYRQVKPQNNSY